MTNLPKKLIQVIPYSNKYSRFKKPSVDSGASHFILEGGDWDDYNFRTSYSLYHTKDYNNNRDSALIGHLRILKRGQQESEINLIGAGLIDVLPEEFCSMGNSLEYYQRLSELDQSIQRQLLSALRDLIADPKIKESFKTEKGFSASLMRDRKENDDIFELGLFIIEQNLKAIFDIDIDLTFNMPELLHPINFDFKSPRQGLFETKTLPERIGVLIGRNGCGKSTILSRMARIACSTPAERNDVLLRNHVGQILPDSIGFTRVLVLSYSPFDSFATPGITIEHKRWIVTEMREGKGSYIFCGTRDIVQELENYVMTFREMKGRLPDADIIADRISDTILKSNKELTLEFLRNITYLKSTRNVRFFSPVMDIIRQEQSINSLISFDLLTSNDDTLSTFFEGLSTGHKFVMHAITSVIAYTALRSLLLFDEPENHLHPPILAVLMKAIRYVLDETNSSMIVATHSPVVLQETLWRHVYVVRKEGDLIKVSKPSLETFGENIGILTQEAFGLSADISQYHGVLDALISDTKASEFRDHSTNNLFKEVEKHFEKGLSIQARSYVLSQLVNKSND